MSVVKWLHSNYTNSGRLASTTTPLRGGARVGIQGARFRRRRRRTRSRPPRWEAEWQPNFSVYDADERAEEFRLWRFPAAYLYEDEGPTIR